MKRSSISASARCSSFLVRALAVLAAVAVLAVAGTAWAASAPVSCQAPGWLDTSVRRGLDAVWAELQRGQLSQGVALRTLERVAQRLFPGFQVELSGGTVVLTPLESWQWTLSVAMPLGNDGQSLAPPLGQWMAQDVAQLERELSVQLQEVPPQALNWASDAFRDLFDQILAEATPGWYGSAAVREGEGNSPILEVQLFPRQPLVLAISPSAISTSLPQLAMEHINDQVLSQLSPLVGLPVAWVSRHQEAVAQWVDSAQGQKGLLKQLQAEVRSQITSRPILRVDASVESRTYSFRGWLSVHAGSGDAQPEIGVHLGRLFPLGSGIRGEFYLQGRTFLSDWEVEGRLGFRFSPLRELWLGLERSTGSDEHWWYHLWLGGGRIGPYGWGRYSDDDDFEGALGYRLNRTFSLELFYDSRREDRLSLRAVSDL